MADPICRWRNTTAETIQLLVRLLPKNVMSEASFKEELKQNCIEEKFDYDSFLSTSYQLAVQIGLYYISEDGVYHPRFSHNLNDSEADEYVRLVAQKYVSPNPYTKSLKIAGESINLYDFFVRRSAVEDIIDVKAALAEYYKLPIGNVDMVVNLMQKSGSFEKVDGQHIRYVGWNGITETKEAYFNHFGPVSCSINLEAQSVVLEEYVAKDFVFSVARYLFGIDGLKSVFESEYVDFESSDATESKNPFLRVSKQVDPYCIIPRLFVGCPTSTCSAKDSSRWFGVPFKVPHPSARYWFLDNQWCDDIGRESQYANEHNRLRLSHFRQLVIDCYPNLDIIASGEYVKNQRVYKLVNKGVNSSFQEFTKAEAIRMPSNVDKLTIALKLFKEARQDGEEIKLSKGNVKALFLEYLIKNPEINDETAHAYVRGLDRGLQVKSGLETVVKEGISSRSLFEIIDANEFAAEANRIMSCASFEEFENRYHVKHIYKHYLAFLRSKQFGATSTNTDQAPWGCLDVRNWFSTYSQEEFQDEFPYFRSHLIWSKLVRGQVGPSYQYVDELGAMLTELKDSPRPISYYASDEFKPKCPEGIGVKTVTDFLMKFHPESYIAFTDNMMDALEVLGMWEHGTKRDIDISYNEFLGQATRVRNRMVEMEIGCYPEGKKPKADYLTVNEFLWWTNINKDLIKEKVMASIYKPVEIKKVNQTKIDNFADFIEKLEKDVKAAGLKYAENLLRRFVCAQLAKPFVVLTGLSGSGKTKLAEAFSRWIGVENTWRIVPVGADWTNSEKLLGYPNALDDESYVLPDTGVLNLMLDATDHPELPFFLILDEMNLSHVERYFADFLSAMESGDEIKLYDGNKRYANGREIPQSFKFPDNLFVIGTMNVDETTYMFSPKVLDRAQVIEFRVKASDMEAFLTSTPTLNLKSISEKGAMYAKAFLELSKLRGMKKPSDDNKLKDVTAALGNFFKPLSELGSEFGYRSAAEILSFVGYYLDSGSDIKATDAIDAAIMQKLLPKLHGSRRQLEKPLEALWKLSLADGGAASIETLAKVEGQVNDFDYKSNCRFPISAEKIARLYKNSKDNGFASFAEA